MVLCQDHRFSTGRRAGIPDDGIPGKASELQHPRLCRVLHDEGALGEAGELSDPCLVHYESAAIRHRAEAYAAAVQSASECIGGPLRRLDDQWRLAVVVRDQRMGSLSTETLSPPVDQPTGM